MGNIKFDFAGKTALVTGGASGLGREMSQEFLRAGAHVVVWDYSESALAALHAEFREWSSRLETQVVDVSKRSSVEAAAKSLKGKIHYLINNAGITRDKTLAKLSPEEWDAVINTNLSGLFHVTQSCLAQFDESSNHKRIINISSVVGLYGNFGQTNYAAAKAGVIGMTKTWAKELGRKGFTVSAVAPGFIQTPMTAAMPQEVLSQMAAKVPVQRLGIPQDIAQTVLFLCSEEAAYINGAVVSVDGGLVL